jgi:hypothetical protein
VKIRDLIGALEQMTGVRGWQQLNKKAGLA